MRGSRLPNRREPTCTPRQRLFRKLRRSIFTRPQVFVRLTGLRAYPHELIGLVSILWLWGIALRGLRTLHRKIHVR